MIACLTPGPGVPARSNSPSLPGAAEGPHVTCYAVTQYRNAGIDSLIIKGGEGGSGLKFCTDPEPTGREPLNALFLFSNDIIISSIISSSCIYCAVLLVALLNACPKICSVLCTAYLLRRTYLRTVPWKGSEAASVGLAGRIRLISTTS